ncbi:MAG: hypothetical protein ACYSUM_13200 [Planctomycetota bacterium]|jgi:hypothetical protein
MDRYQKWSAYLADLKTLYSEWERRHLAGVSTGRRFREINTICLFALCLENNESKRFLVGFQERGVADTPVPVNTLFEDAFGEIEDVDVILVPDLGPDGPSEREVHRCQLVSYCNRADPSTADMTAFLEEKKLCVPRDDDLILIVHVEQPTRFGYVRLSIDLQLRQPQCPYSQVFVLGQVTETDPPRWFCTQVYPRLIPLHELNGPTAREVLADRDRVCVRPSESE